MAIEGTAYTKPKPVYPCPQCDAKDAEIACLKGSVNFDNRVLADLARANAEIARLIRATDKATEGMQAEIAALNKQLTERGNEAAQKTFLLARANERIEKLEALLEASMRCHCDTIWQEEGGHTGPKCFVSAIEKALAEDDQDS